MTTEVVFCDRCQRILGIDCHCLSTRSLSVTEGIQSDIGDSGDNGLSPAAPYLTREDLAAVTAVTDLSLPLGAQAESGEIPVTRPGDNDLALSPVTGAYSHQSSRGVNSWTAAGLLGEVFTEPRWAVPGLIPEGLTLLAGPPKIGKSWLALDLCVAVASGGKALGAIDVEPGPVLYLALEDSPRRLQKRLRQVLAGAPAPAELVLAIECPPLPSGGLDRLRRHFDWYQDRGQDVRLVVIDVFEKVRGPAPANVSAYAADYTAVTAIKRLADAYSCAVVLIHHVRKAGSDDFLNEISGTNGLSGAADTIAVLKRARGDADGRLVITGRDVEEADYALRFEPKLGAWQLIGLSADLDITDTRRKILAYVRGEPGAKPAAIALGTGLGRDLVKQTCRRMADDGQLDTDGQGRYFEPVPVVELPDA